jgi:hypothetical protein
MPFNATYSSVLTKASRWCGLLDFVGSFRSAAQIDTPNTDDWTYDAVGGYGCIRCSAWPSWSAFGWYVICHSASAPNAPGCGWRLQHFRRSWGSVVLCWTVKSHADCEAGLGTLADRGASPTGAWASTTRLKLPFSRPSVGGQRSPCCGCDAVGDGPDCSQFH